METSQLIDGGGRAARTLVLFAAVAVTASACIGRMGRVRDPFGGGGARDGGGRIEVEVQNLNFNDATLFAVRAGQQIRLGQVTGKTDRTFTVDWDFALPLAFQVDLVGGHECSTRGLQVDPGDHIWLQIPSDVGLTPCRSGKR